MSDRDFARAKLLDGTNVEISAKLLLSSDVRAALPQDRGEINGRLWTGTNCDGEYVAFVDKLVARSE